MSTICLGLGVGLTVTKAIALTPLLTNLISFWELEEASGTRVDAHGTNDLTDVNTVGQIAGKIGNAADFIAANDESLSRANADAASLQMGTQDLTFACWLNMDASQPDARCPLCAMGGQTPTDEGYHVILYPARNRWFSRLSDGTTLISDDGTFTAFSAGDYHLMIYEFDRDAKMQGYIDNVPAGAGESISALDGMDIQSGKNFEIAGTVSVSSWNIDGGLDECAIWRRLLTADEKTFLWNGGAGRTFAEIQTYTG